MEVTSIFERLEYPPPVQIVFIMIQNKCSRIPVIFYIYDFGEDTYDAKLVLQNRLYFFLGYHLVGMLSTRELFCIIHMNCIYS